VSHGWPVGVAHKSQEARIQEGGSETTKAPFSSESFFVFTLPPQKDRPEPSKWLYKSKYIKLRAAFTSIPFTLTSITVARSANMTRLESQCHDIELYYCKVIGFKDLIVWNYKFNEPCCFMLWRIEMFSMLFKIVWLLS